MSVRELLDLQRCAALDLSAQIFREGGDIQFFTRPDCRGI